MKLSDFNCDNCIKRRKHLCCDEKPYVAIPEEQLGCSNGSWVIQMTKWSGYINDKEPPVYIVSWDWLAREIGRNKDRFKILEIDI